MIKQARQLKRAFGVMPDVASTVLRLAAAGGSLNAVYGPASAMFVMFSRNDWCILPSGEFRGQVMWVFRAELFYAGNFPCYPFSVVDICSGGLCPPQWIARHARFA